MKFGDFYYPFPVNEPVLTYAPGTAERKLLKETLQELKSKKIDKEFETIDLSISLSISISCLSHIGLQ